MYDYYFSVRQNRLAVGHTANICAYAWEAFVGTNRSVLYFNNNT